jgi:F-type H+-transporting ATPase subunit a
VNQLFTVAAAKLPLGEHWWLIGNPNSLWNIHMDTVVMTLAGIAILSLVGWYIQTHFSYERPSRLQSGIEMAMSFIDNIIRQNLGRNPGIIANVALALFFYLLVMNIIGLLPFPYIDSPTADVNTTFALALMVFVLMQRRYIVTSGIAAYKGHYWTRGLRGIFFNPLSVLLAIVTELSRPLTLSFRLFGNILAGEILLLLAGILLPAVTALVANVIVNPLLVVYDVFVAVVQAFIFTVLTIAYMAIASEPVGAHGSSRGH